ncbi:MAG: hypothetical protein JNL32_07105 [Candidatus Kapabacteria bacterium]|nr:hypothetical protein [Candidatus Kapabacteria bacterium]
MGIILTIHSHNRWLVLLLAVAVIIKLLVIKFGKKEWTALDTWLTRSYTILMSIQFVLGIILFFNIATALGWEMSPLRKQFEHLVSMLIAIAFSHIIAKYRSLPSQERATKTLRMVALSLVFVFAGVAQLRGLGFWFGGM